jgi:tRNA U34 2-thiouridine synthase MnmA/TrmU
MILLQNNVDALKVRSLAKKWKLPTADEPESMGLCFVGERRKFNSFIGIQLAVMSSFSDFGHRAIPTITSR